MRDIKLILLDMLKVIDSHRRSINYLEEYAGEGVSQHHDKLLDDLDTELQEQIQREANGTPETNQQ